MTWEIVGHSAASRRYANKQEFIDEVLAHDSISFNKLWEKVTPDTP